MGSVSGTGKTVAGYLGKRHSSNLPLCHPRERGDPWSDPEVIRELAWSGWCRPWIPAFAGMTNIVLNGPASNHHATYPRAETFARSPALIASIRGNLDHTIGTIRDDDAVAVEEKRPAYPAFGLRSVDAEPASRRNDEHS